MNLKITDKAKAEFEFYRNTPLDMIGVNVGIEDFRADPNGYSALECWYARDTYGKLLSCREIELLAKVERSKKSVNLQVKMWAEDIADGMLLRQEELVEYVHGWPEWVFPAVMAQAHLIALRKLVGDVKAEFVKGYEKLRLGPRFARAEYLFGNLWFPHMDRFDASI